MLSKSDVDVSKIITRLQELEINASFIVPTETGLKKSILDATFQVREFLKSERFHDFQDQKQGSSHKVVKKCFFVTKDNLIESTVSLYKPETKSGDPRIWFYGLKKYVKANNLLALIILESDLYILNCSDDKILKNIIKNRFIRNKFHLIKDPIFDELFEKMIEIHNKGYVPAVGKGHKAIGETLEDLLGINPNSSKGPDYKGIELKSSRSSKNRSNLFSKAPNWKISRLKYTKGILEERGVFSEKDNRIGLNHTMKANEVNSYNMLLRVEENNNLLRQNFISHTEEVNDVVWYLDDLTKALLDKHPKTFWVKADARTENNKEYFLYQELIYTHSPNPSYFIALLESGLISLDYVMHLRKDGSARDHGYLFKILPSNLDKLFPEPQSFSLNA